MPILPKPFSWTEKLKRIYFLGRPAYFNAIDFNKELDIIHNSLDEDNDTLGVKSTVVFTLANISHVSSAGTDTNSFDYSWSAGDIFYKGVKYAIPAQSVITHTDSFATPSGSPLPFPKTYYFILRGTLVTKDFTSDAALCGIQSDEYPTLVPSCEVTQYTNVQVFLTTNPAGVANKIAILGTVMPRYDNAANSLIYEFFNNTYLPADVPFLGDASYTAGNFQTNKSIIEQNNYLDKKYAKVYEPNYFESTQNIKYSTNVSYNSTTQAVTINGPGNIFEVDLGAFTDIKTIIPHSTYRDYGVLHLRVKSNAGYCRFIPALTGTFLVQSTLTVQDSDFVTLSGFLFGGSLNIWNIIAIGARTILKNITDTNTAISALSATVTSADNALDARLDVLESPNYTNMNMGDFNISFANPDNTIDYGLSAVQATKRGATMFVQGKIIGNLANNGSINFQLVPKPGTILDRILFGGSTTLVQNAKAQGQPDALAQVDVLVDSGTNKLYFVCFLANYESSSTPAYTAGDWEVNLNFHLWTT
jgi:hypothetical protein